MARKRDLSKRASAALAQARERLGLTQGEIAQKLRCTQSTISRLESGGIARVPLEQLAQIAKAYGLTTEELVA